MRTVPLLALSACSFQDLFEATILPEASPPTGFDLSLLGETTYGFTGTGLAAGELDGVPGDDLVVVMDSEPGGPLTSSAAAVWTGDWTGSFALEQDAHAVLSAPIGGHVTSAATGDFDGD